MGTLKPTLGRKIALATALLHLALLPLLYFGIAWNIRRNQTDSFVNHARNFTRTLVEELEAGSVGNDEHSIKAFLDSLALGGEISFVEYRTSDRAYTSELLVARGGAPAAEDFDFGVGADNTYYLSAAVLHAGSSATLQVGFDEAATLETIHGTLRGVVIALAGYLLAALASAYFLGVRIVEPLRALRNASRRVASGEHTLPLQASSSIREISDLAQDLESMREELLGVSAHLATQLKEREELENRLQQKQRIETIGTLAGGLAHEFNNVLVPITLFGELAMDRIPPDHPAHADMQRVMLAVARATGVASKILTFSRQGSTGERQLVRINDAVREGLDLFSVLCPPQIQLITDLEEGCDPILADATLIVQVVMNLCTNSLQAMLPEGGELWVSTRTIGAGDLTSGRGTTGRYVELTIEDTGQGMDPETLERIYEPFFTKRDVGQGTGLGLSIVHGIVTSLHGTIQVQSSIGRGTVFHVLLPSAADSALNQGAVNDIDSAYR